MSYLWLQLYEEVPKLRRLPSGRWESIPYLLGSNSGSGCVSSYQGVPGKMVLGVKTAQSTGCLARTLPHHHFDPLPS